MTGRLGNALYLDLEDEVGLHCALYSLASVLGTGRLLILYATRRKSDGDGQSDIPGNLGGRGIRIIKAILMGVSLDIRKKKGST